MNHLIQLKVEGAAQQCRAAQFVLDFVTSIFDKASKKFNGFPKVLNSFIKSKDKYYSEYWMVPKILEKCTDSNAARKSNISQYGGYICSSIGYAYLEFSHYRKFSGSNLSLKRRVHCVSDMIYANAKPNNPKTQTRHSTFSFTQLQFRRKVFLNIYIHDLNSQIFVENRWLGGGTPTPALAPSSLGKLGPFNI